MQADKGGNVAHPCEVAWLTATELAVGVAVVGEAVGVDVVGVVVVGEAVGVDVVGTAVVGDVVGESVGITR